MTRDRLWPFSLAGVARVRVPIVAGLAVAVTVLAGCGGSSYGGSPSTTPSSNPVAAVSISSKDVFVAAADTICQQAESQVTQPPGDPSQARADQLPSWQTYLQAVVPIEQQELSSLRALAPPASDEATINDIFNKEQVAIGDSHAALQAAAQGDFAGFQAAVARFKVDNPAAMAAASAYGLDTCAE